MRNEELRYRLEAMIFLFCRVDLWSPETVEKYKNNRRTLFAPTMRCVVVMVCGINSNAMRNVEGAGRRERRPLQICCRGGRVSVVFLFNFQASNKVQEVLFCAIRTSHRVHLTHALRMFPHTLLPCRIFDLG